MSAKIIGNPKALFSMHGDVDSQKAIDALSYMTELAELNIEEINKSSELGMLLVQGDGRILDKADNLAERVAKYKIVPTGLNLRYTNYPLFASFIKVNGFWEGTFIGTGTQLFSMYKKYHNDTRSPFKNDFMQIFGDENRSFNIQGFGLSEVLENKKIKDKELDDLINKSKDTNDDAEAKHITEIEKALEKAKKELSNDTKKSKSSKAQRKAARLEAHLQKIKKSEEAKKERERLQEEHKKEQHKFRPTQPNEYIKLESIKWLEVTDIDSVAEYFEDNATKEFLKRLHESIGAENAKKDDFISQVSIVKVDDTVRTNNLNEPEIELEAVALVDKDNTTENKEELNSDANANTEIVSDKEIDAAAEVDEKEDNSINKEVENAINIAAEAIGKAVSDPENEVEKDNNIIDEAMLKSMDHDYIEEGEEDEENLIKGKYEIRLKFDLIREIYDRLLSKEYWKIDPKNRLGFFIKGIFLLAALDKEKNATKVIKGNGYTFSKDFSKQVVNIGLLDKYGNYIYLVDHTPYIANFYMKKITMLTNKAMLLDWGFDINDIRKLPQPVKIVDDFSSCIFRGYIEDFDLDDSIHLKHIIEERINRFPEKYRKQSTKMLCDRLKQAMEQAIRISKNDYKYIVPKYNFERNIIQFLIPFYLDRNIDDQPELTIVVGNHKGIWQIYTVLRTDDAYDDARLLCKPSSEWLIPNRARKH